MPSVHVSMQDKIRCSLRPQYSCLGNNRSSQKYRFTSEKPASLRSSKDALDCEVYMVSYLNLVTIQLMILYWLISKRESSYVFLPVSERRPTNKQTNKHTDR